MLVLTRKETQTILIGDSIRVTIVRSSNGRCRIGIDAPKDVQILREEVAKKERRAA